MPAESVHIHPDIYEVTIALSGLAGLICSRAVASCIVHRAAKRDPGVYSTRRDTRLSDPPHSLK
jgi:hypothetical protein